MFVGWPICRCATESPRFFGGPIRTVICWAVSVAVLVGAAACSVTVVEVEPVDTDVTGIGASPGDPITPVLPTQPVGNSPSLLAIEPLTAFMDACVADAGLVGPCHCAVARLEGSLTALDFVVFEDRMTGGLEFSPELASVLVNCRDAAPPPAWSQERQLLYLDECSVGEDRLRSLCACSLARAQDVVPAHRLDDFLMSTEVQPDIVDFIAECI